MQILLVVATLVVGLAVLYVTATFSTRTRQNTAPLIDAAAKDISGQIEATAGDLKAQLKVLADELQRDRDQARLEARKIQSRLDHVDNRISGIVAELETLMRLNEHIGARQDRLSADLRQLDHQVAHHTEATLPAAHAGQGGDGGTGGEAVGATAADSPAVTDRFYAERLRFFIAGVPPQSFSWSERQFRILVERYVAELPAQQLGDLGPARAIAERAEHDEGFRARLSEAASDYLANKWADPAFAAATESWITQPFPETAAAAVCDRISDGLETILQKPLEKAGTELGLPGPEAATAAGIGSTLILQPVTRPLGQIAKAIEITAVAVGLATGLHPLVLAAGKMLARAEVHDMVARGLGKAVRSVLEGPGGPAEAPEPARPAEVREPARPAEVPEPARPPGQPRTFSIPLTPPPPTTPQPPPESQDPARFRPTMDGPGGL